MDFLIKMARPDLENLPPLDLPEGYHLATAADFEDPAPMWAKLINEAFGDRQWTPQYVEENYAGGEQYDPRGVFFIMCGDEAVSTAFAWVDQPGETQNGRVHWVASLPEHRGKGLARLVVAAVLHHLKQRGFAKAFLETQPYRLPAISVYLKLGFDPVLRNAGNDMREEEAWQQVMDKLGRR